MVTSSLTKTTCVSGVIYIVRMMQPIFSSFEQPAKKQLNVFPFLSCFFFKKIQSIEICFV